MIGNGHDLAREIASTLAHRGLPVVGYHDAAGKIGVTFRLEDEAARYTARLPRDEASADEFQRLYEVVA